jgi:MoaA/NifB/PqqE/SkfB family radical SAM enzyme
MIVRRHSINYNFFGDTQSGVTMRWASSVGNNPGYAPWPELADISISNHCSKGCDFCYRESSENNSFMSAEQYEKVLDSLHSERWGNVFQVALGGGEPLEHPDFKKIIEITNKKGIVANFTTNGVYLDNEMICFLKGKIGALAISAASINDLSIEKMQLLKQNGIKTNIHFILDNNSVSQAIRILKGKYNEVLKSANGVIFLTYKPKGRAVSGKCLKMNADMNKFIKLINKNKCACSIGFDACFVPILMKYTEVNVDYIDSCECGFFSVYIDEKMNVKPCSFADNNKFTYNLNKYGMQVIWGKKYDLYRKEILKNKCGNDCKNKDECRGKCIYFDEVSFCYVN